MDLKLITENMIEDFTVVLPNPTLKGEKGDQGIQGEKGDNGYTPIKGIDYFTSEEIASVEANVENALLPKFDEKQDVIEDLEAIRSGASKGATAVQDNAYVHTDNNFTSAEKSKLNGLHNYDDTDVKNEIKSLHDEDTSIRNRINEIEVAKFPNLTIIGSPTIQQGQVSNITNSNYLKFPFVVNFQNRPFSIKFDITTGANVTNQENIFDSDFGLAFAIRSGRFVCAYSINGISWDSEHVGTHAITSNTSYSVVFSWDGNTYKVEYSLDGGNTFITDMTFTNTLSPYPKQIYVGVGENNGIIQNHFSGIINLNKAELIISDKVVWQGMDDVGLATRLAVDLSNIDEAGERKIRDIVSEDIESATEVLSKEIESTNKALAENKRIDDARWAINQGQTWDNVIRENNGDVDVLSGEKYFEPLMVGGMSRKGKNVINYATEDKYSQGITWSESNGLITAKGTATDTWAVFNWIDFTIKKGTYTFSIDKAYTGCKVCLDLSDGSTQYTLPINKGEKSYTLTIPNDCIRFRFSLTSISDTNVDISFHPMLNEGSTALPYEPYTSELINAPVTDVVSRGKNLFSPFANAFISNGNGSYSSSVNAKCTDFIKTNGNDYTVIASGYNSSIQYANLYRVGAYDSNKNWIKNITITSANAYKISTHFIIDEVAYIKVSVPNELLNSIQVEKGSTATPYTPYFEQHNQFPQSVLDKCPDYGIGINENCYNYIDFNKKQYVRNVGSVDLGSLNWTMFVVAQGNLFRCWVTGSKTFYNSLSALCSAYPTVKASERYDKSLSVNDNSSFDVVDTNYTVATAFKQAMQGVMLYHELATPEVIDLSDVLPDYDYIPCESNGMITYEYQGKDTYKVDVPNSNEFIVKLSEVE